MRSYDKSCRLTRPRAIAHPTNRYGILQANISDFMDNRPESRRQKVLQALIHSNPAPPVQCKIKIGKTLYKKGKRGRSSGSLITRVEKKLSEGSLCRGWKKYVKDRVNEEKTHSYEGFNAFKKKLKELFKPVKNSRKRKREEQDNTILGLLSDVKEPKRKKARILARESRKAFDQILKDISGLEEYQKTEEEIKKLTSGKRSLTTDIGKTENPLFVLDIISKHNNRLDYNFNNVFIDTHGYESMKDRSVDPNDLKQSFGFGTVKIGPNIGTYEKELKKKERPREDEMKTLNELEKLRIPQVSSMLGLKRDFFRKKKISKEMAFGTDQPFSNVEFKGAVTGSDLTKKQKKNMRQQQVFSNIHILDELFNQFPDEKIGFSTTGKKGKQKTVTPKQIKEELDFFSGTLETTKPKKKKTAKRALRRRLKRSLLSTSNISGIESDNEVSDVEDDDYGEKIFEF